jgi:hypothetical protein
MGIDTIEEERLGPTESSCFQAEIKWDASIFVGNGKNKMQRSPIFFKK